MEKIRIKLDWLISPVLYVLNALIFPKLISELIFNIRVYKQCINYIKGKIRTSEPFKQFLDSNDFNEAWFGRLYSLRALDPKLGTFDDEALQSYVMRLVSEKWSFLVNQGFIEILIMKTKKLGDNSYLLILEIANFNVIKSIIYHLIFAGILWGFIIRISLVFYTSQIHMVVEAIKHFFIQIF